MPTTGQNGTTSSDTLQGWKEIANYLGRSTRAVQRWEDELKLPVHRIQGANGPTVYALRSEIDDWKKSRDLPKPTQEEVAEAAAGAAIPLGAASPVADTPQESTRASRPTWRLLALCVVLALSVGAWTGQHFRVPPLRIGPIAGFDYVGRSIIALDAQGHVVWTYDFGRQVSRADDHVDNMLGGHSVPATTDDIIVLGVRLAAPGGPQTESDIVVGFTRDGHERWRFTPQFNLTCGTEKFGGPWSVSYIVFGQDTKNPKTYVSFRSATEWPSMLLELDEDANARLLYVQTGWIRALAEWQTPLGHLLAIGGVYNEFGQPSTTLIDLNAASPSMSPHSQKRFDCADMPTGQPVAAFVWPTLDVKAESAYPMNTEVRVLENGLLSQLEETGGNALMTINTDLAVTSFTLADNYWVVHNRRQADGFIKHTAEACPERTRPQPIEKWTPATGWVHSTIVPTLRDAVLKK